MSAPAAFGPAEGSQEGSLRYLNNIRRCQGEGGQPGITCGFIVSNVHQHLVNLINTSTFRLITRLLRQRGDFLILLNFPLISVFF